MKTYIKIVVFSIICLFAFTETNIYAQTDSTTHQKMMNNNMMNRNMMDSSHMKMMNNKMMNGSHMMNMTDSTHMHMMDSTSAHMMDNHKINDMKHEKINEMAKNPIIHEGLIDLKAIDKNKDGKVYQDMMDWNVISDKPGECPICGMKLKEVTIDQAKKNLADHSYKVK